QKKNFNAWIELQGGDRRSTRKPSSSTGKAVAGRRLPSSHLGRQCFPRTTDRFKPSVHRRGDSTSWGFIVLKFERSVDGVGSGGDWNARIAQGNAATFDSQGSHRARSGKSGKGPPD